MKMAQHTEDGVQRIKETIPTTCICILLHRSSLFLTVLGGGRTVYRREGAMVTKAKEEEKYFGGNTNDESRAGMTARSASLLQCWRACWMNTETKKKRQAPSHDDVHSIFLSSLYFFPSYKVHSMRVWERGCISALSSSFCASRVAYSLCFLANGSKCVFLTLAVCFNLGLARHFARGSGCSFPTFFFWSFAKLM